MCNRNHIIFLTLLISTSLGIQIPLLQGQYRCMLVYSAHPDQTIKIEIDFPLVDHWQQADHYFLTLRNTKTGRIESEKVMHGLYRREFHIQQRIIYEVCFEFLSPREVTQQMLVNYNADTHFMFDSKAIKLPQNLLKTQQLEEAQESAMALKNLTNIYIKFLQQRSVKEDAQFKQAQKTENRIVIISVIEIAAILGFGLYQFYAMKKKLRQNKNFPHD